MKKTNFILDTFFDYKKNKQQYCLWRWCSTCGNMRIRNVALVNDIATLKVVAHLNGTIHGVMDEKELGIMFTKCRKCGGKVVTMRDAIKCTDCSWIDERKLSSNFGKTDFVHLTE